MELVSEKATGGVLLKKSSLEFRKFNMKTPLFESLFNRLADLQTVNFVKMRLQHRCFPAKFATLRTAASVV